MRDPRRRESDRPAVEPEILPPEAADPWRRADSWPGGGFSQRIVIRRIGPFGLALLGLAFLGIFLLLLVVFAGLVLIWLPAAAAVLVAGFVLARLGAWLGRR